MTTKHQISAVAERTGFTTSALRYYESIGLVVPDRTESGYRVYDDGDVQFLTFASRAKHMGLSLDEITELAELWKERRCAPVAAKLHEMVGERAATVRGRIEELQAFHAELQQLHASIDPLSAGDDPCGDTCGCNPVTTTDRTASMRLLPMTTADTPIACTLGADAGPERVAEWQSLLEEASKREDVLGGIRFVFPAGRHLAERVASLATAEQDCCSFFVFALSLSAEATTLTVHAPAGAEPMLDAIFGQPATGATA